MTVVFLSYRRSDSEKLAARLCDRLVREWGLDAVFMDRSIIPGNEFPKVLAEALSKCQVLLAVIGPTWPTVTEANGVRRLHNPRDFVRREIETGLQRQVHVLPVLVGGLQAADLHERSWKLPESLVSLRERHPAVIAEVTFNADVDALILQLKDLLSPKSAATAAEVTCDTVSGEHTGPLELDREFPTIAAACAQGHRLIVIAGPAGIGKTVTAHAAVRAGQQHILKIDAWEELCPLSLVDQVGQNFPEELYRDHPERSFISLPFADQHRLAVELLAQRQATVIIDGPGLRSHPRDATAEMELARGLAQELAAGSVQVLVTTRHETCWSDYAPIVLKGLTEDDAGKLLQREFQLLGCSDVADGMARQLGGVEVLRGLLERGHPGELMEVARRAGSQSTAPIETQPGFARRLAVRLRSLAEALFGDPVSDQPQFGMARSRRPRGLLAASLLMFAVSTAGLVGAYCSGSPLWERMYYMLAANESSVPALGATSTAGGLGPGFVVELTRSVMLVFGLVLIVIGSFFGKEAASLLPTAPWKKCGPRRLGLRSLFRIIFVVLASWLSVATLVHHTHDGPRILWMSNGNPYLQAYIDAADPATLQELRDLPADDPRHMNGEPPQRNEPRYEEYWRQCVVPYRSYFAYSFILFVAAGTTVLTVCFYAVCVSLLEHLIAQPRRIAELPDETHPYAIDNWLRYFKGTYAADIDRYSVFLLVMLGAWAFHLWLDQLNLTGSAEGYTTVMILIAVGAWLALFSAQLLTYQALVRQAAKRIPEGPMLHDFQRRHGFFRFFWREAYRSKYFWLCLIAGAAAALWHLRALFAGWLR